MKGRPVISSQRFPAASYGQGSKGYSVLGCSNDFPETALNEWVQKITRRLEWRPNLDASGDERYEPGFALWRLEKDPGVLAVRVCDVGRGDRDRPHTLKIDAVYIQKCDFVSNFPVLSPFLDQSAWPSNESDVVTDGHLELKLRSDLSTSNPAIQRLAEDLKSCKRVPRLLVLPSGLYCRNRNDYEAIFSIPTGRWEQPIPDRLRAEELTLAESPDEEKGASNAVRNTRTSRPWPQRLFAFSVAANVLSVVLTLYFSGESDRYSKHLAEALETQRKLEMEKDDLTRQLASERKKIEGFRQRTDSEMGRERESQERIRKLLDSLIPLESDLNRLKSSLDSLRLLDEDLNRLKASLNGSKSNGQILEDK
jgi:hypothetical protein